MGNRIAAGRPRAPFSVLSAAALLALFAAFATARWSGHLPFGSDNDEYRLVEESLRRSGRPWVGGVEGSKYPPGYPTVLVALHATGLPVGWAGLALNLALIAGTAALVSGTARRLDSPAAGTIAAAALVSAWALWLVGGYLTPDVAFAFVVAAAALAASSGGFDRALPAAALAAAATLLRTAGVALAGAIAVSAIVDRPRRPRAAAAAAGGGLLAVAVQRLLAAGLPVHTTSYARDFWFRDPYDHARGLLSPAGIAARALSRVPDLARNLGQALGGAILPSAIAVPIAVGALVLAVSAFPGRRAFAAAFVVLLLATILVWPFSGVHFCVPLIPLAAAGLGVAFSRWRRSPSPLGRPGAAIVAAALAVTAASGFVYLRRVAASERATLPILEGGAADLASWIDRNVPAADSIASFDYREIALRTGRPILPIPYTSDAGALWAMTGGRGARWLVASDLVFPLRGAYAAQLMASRPGCFAKVHRNTAFRVYRIDGDACAAVR